MIAGGTGITPMIQITGEILSNDDEETRITLLYSVSSVNEIIEKTLLDDWSTFWNFTVHYFITVSENSLCFRFKVV